MRERAAALLESFPSPVPSSLLALELLGLSSAPPETCRAVLEPLLAGDLRFRRDDADRWTLNEPVPAAIGSAPPLQWTWALWSAEPGLRAVAVVRLEMGRIASERIEMVEDRTAPRSGAAAARGRAPGRISPANWRQLAHCGEDAHWVAVDRGTSLAAISAMMSAQGAPGRPDSSFSLARLALASLGPPLPRSLEQILSRLGVPAVAAEDPLVKARLGAECLLLLLDRPEIAARRSPEELSAFLKARPAAYDFTGRGFDLRFLESLPEEPGTYRFIDRDGKLLYVGKSVNLFRRVGSYFAPRSRPDPRTSAWLEQVHKIEIEASASELEALLREAQTITRERPLKNTQRLIHQRKRAGPANLVLLLPARREGSVRVYLIRGEEIAARVTLGPRDGGLDRLRRRLDEVYFQPADRGEGPPEPAVAEPVRLPPPSARRERAILHSWLRRNRGLARAYDPTEAEGPDRALAVAQQYARSLRRGEQPVVHR